MVAFVTSIGAAFTGYLSQTNFDSQWISGEAKDGINSIGVGGFMNVLNPAQMLMWHIVLLPLAVGVIAVLHILMVRRHGVVPPIGDEEASSMTADRPAEPPPPPRTPHSHDYPTRSYDLVKEFVIALVVMTGLSLVLAGIFSSPDDQSITMSRLGHERTGGRGRHGRRRAGRHHDQRDVRRAVQPRLAGPVGARAEAPEVGRRRATPSTRPTSCSSRCGRRPANSLTTAALAQWDALTPDAADRGRDGVRRRPGQGAGRQPGEGGPG